MTYARARELWETLRVRRARGVVGVVLILVGCSASGGDAGSRPLDRGAVSGEEDRSKRPRDDALARVCASPCAGDFASVTVFRDAEGRAARLVFDGDLEACSHPPRHYFDARGEETLVIAERPVAPGSEDAEALAAAQDAEVAGLRKAETLRCR